MAKTAHFSTIFLPLLRKAAGETVGDVLLPGYVKVSVDVGGHLDVGVAQPFLDILQAKSVVEEQAGAAVSQLMEPDVGQVVLPQQGGRSRFPSRRNWQLPTPCSAILRLKTVPLWGWLSCFFPVPEMPRPAAIISGIL